MFYNESTSHLILFNEKLMSKLIQNKKFIIAVSGMLALSFLASCETKQQSGVLLGGATGALLGSQFGSGSGKVLGAGLGALLGAFAGGQIGKYMDRQDKMRMEKTTQTALERGRTGQTSSWKNPDSGHSGTVTTTQTFQNDGRYCREYTQTINIGGKIEKGYGTACRQPDGAWQVVS